MDIMTGLCKAAVSLYPREFRSEFGDDITASFKLHYGSLRGKESGSMQVRAKQVSDIWDITKSAFRERLSGSDNRSSREQGFGDGTYRLVYRLYFAWQCYEEADFLQDMSRKGWHFIEYTLGWYWFRKADTPMPYEFKFERRFFSSGEEILRYLDDRETGGWEFFKQWWGWYYFRRPLTEFEVSTREPLADIQEHRRPGILYKLGEGAKAVAYLVKGGSAADSPSGRFKIVNKLYFAWQCYEEADFLTHMSEDGWEFVEYTLGCYWFRKSKEPVPYEFRFERKYFMQGGKLTGYLEERDAGGWEFFKEWMNWYYFRRPIRRGSRS